MKTALILVNLGSPDSPETRDVRVYLNEFLMDERVIDIPKFWRTLLVKGIISPFRAPKSAAKYRRIWTKEGAPLIAITENLTKLVAAKSGIPAYYCMRYANPTPSAVLEQIAKEHPDLDAVIMVPLYPHYAMSSYETAVEHVKAAFNAGKYSFQLLTVPPFYNHPSYLRALAESIRPFLSEPYDHILFTYHGVPVRHILKSDITGCHCMKVDNCCEVPSPAHQFCYRHQVKVTTDRVAELLNIPKDKYSFSFQSRLGSDKWLQPYTAERLKNLPKEGVKKLVVVSPAFVADCLETIEELDDEGKEIFESNGGEHFTRIPCLNVNELWVDTVVQLAEETMRSVFVEK
ncbi:ferrochelatase [Thermaurantimonas aggregans]|uniref:Ferrochelatase n=1 Tax=Thermaurantimonas aggregans TaxID=2173829 RepID=A0A401XN86_9FLAO|nr:ferrochelatase [Thermaurantimonas aggregans]MCX8148481.1 ferrochelatase [Thermaurantimonas aggregans]GCD78465.1 ferrochelatase [Thermaurantimonas aggregans]